MSVDLIYSWIELDALAALPIIIVNFTVSDFSNIGRPSLNSIADILPGSRSKAWSREVTIDQKVLIWISASNHNIADSDSVWITFASSLKADTVLTVLKINTNLSMSDSIVTTIIWKISDYLISNFNDSIWAGEIIDSICSWGPIEGKDIVVVSLGWVRIIRYLGEIWLIRERRVLGIVRVVRISSWRENRWG